MLQRSPEDFDALVALRVKINDRIRTIDQLYSIVEIDRYYKADSTKQALFDFEALFKETETLLNRLSQTY